MSTAQHRWILGMLIVLLGVAVTAVYAPYVYFEAYVLRNGRSPSPLPPPSTVAGRWFDDYFVVETLGPSTYAIGEPRYYQGNYSYLLVGERRALLFDGGSGLRDIVPVVRSLTTLPVTVLPSHLHFDHVGSLGRLDRTALVDDPGLKTRLRHGKLRLTRYEFLGAMDRLEEPAFAVDDWVADGEVLDLGGRRLEVWRTPGHTPTSITLWDPQQSMGFVGDLIYPGELYAFLPGASLGDYAATVQRLLRQLPLDARLYAAHMEERPTQAAAPLLHRQDLEALSRTLDGWRQGRLRSTGVYPQVYPVAGPMSLATGFAWNLR